MRKYLLNFIFIMLILPNICFAITCSTDKHKAEVEIEKSTLNINENTNIKVTSDWNDINVEYKVAPKDFAIVNNDGLLTALKDGNIKINMTINFLKENDEIDDSCKLSIPIEILSHDSSLKKLTLEELDISPNFNPKQLSYDVKLPYKFDKVNIIAEASSGSAKITGAGRRYLNAGKNEYNIVVTASDGTSTTYKINIIREDANDDATLESLIVEGYALEPKFNKDTYKYELNVGKEVETIKINAKPTYEFAKIRGIGEFALATGKNTYYITVTAENGNELKYEIQINKNLGSSFLTQLEVKNYKLNPSFNSDTFIYNLTVNSEITKLDINDIGSENDQVEIIGNEQLEYGENEIVIRVTGDDKTTTTYKIVVNRLSAEEEYEIKKNDILTKILLIIFIVSIIIMVSCIAIFIKRNWKRKYTLKTKKKVKKNKKK